MLEWMCCAFYLSKANNLTHATNKSSRVKNPAARTLISLFLNALCTQNRCSQISGKPASGRKKCWHPPVGRQLAG